ncbi:MAG: hypothetical protein IJ104_01080, partial [Methanobrevibacter sp.]|nr:hypothetical protein [Methanobrevibacter sp.]
ILISKYKMQKVIFKLKMDLGKNHELYDELPYYWYFHGPFSETVNDSWNYILPKCNVNLNSLILSDEYYKMFDIENNIISGYSEIESFINQILSNESFHDLDKYIYKEYAPYSFMYSFKYQIFNTANTIRSSNYFDVDKYIDIFYDCESQLPCESYFNEYNDLFSKLSTNLDLINDENNFNNYWNFLRDPIVELWKTFARGLRVNFKDDFYNYKVSSWDRKYKSSINELKILINETDKLINFMNSAKEYSPSQKKLLNATISAYLRG